MANAEVNKKGNFADLNFPKTSQMFAGCLDSFKFPETSQMVAGTLGCPCALYLMTPARNACTIAAQASSASIAECYGQVFAKGFLGGWTGGSYVAAAGVPQGLLVGPCYHAFASFAGKWGGLALTGVAETVITYGAQTKNAQLAAIATGKGALTPDRVQNPFKPFGPGVSVHVTRNLLAMSGMRITCEPITHAIEKIVGGKSAAGTLAGDFLANITAAGITFPLNQLYNYIAITPSAWTGSFSHRLGHARRFLSDTYFVETAGGSRRLSPILMRDFILRSIYIGAGYTIYLNFERACVSNWPF